MHIHIITMGKWKRQHPEHQLFNAYIKRSRWSVELHELAAMPKLPHAERRQKETMLLYETASHYANNIILCDERGKSLHSKALASLFERWRDEGERSMAFIIGSDIGIDADILPNHVRQLSLGNMTWPHLLVRVLLAEQVYRVQTILSGHPYHRD